MERPCELMRRTVMRIHVAAVVGLVAASSVAGCTSPDGDAGATSVRSEPTSSRTATPSLAPASLGRMEIDQRTYLPGDELSVRWPGQQLRGIAYSLDAWTGTAWRTRYYIAAVTPGYRANHDPTWWDADGTGRGWVDIGVGGAGPDIAVVPDTAGPGGYRLCTANSPKQSCALLTVGAAR
ncbi:hypothetical protein [Nocardioides aquiterrae]|uniref:Uncharacterized protein n=1 Tax=Nocardioides aquiterrae TaxID=203799 RepID=A0ABP4F7M0_9ACTN